MRSAFCQRDLMVYFLYRHELSVRLTKFTQRVRLCVAVSDAFPCATIPTAYSRVSVVLLVAFVFHFLMLRAKPTVCQLRTARIGTRSLRLLWHIATSFSGITKALQDFSNRASVYYSFAL